MSLTDDRADMARMREERLREEADRWLTEQAEARHEENGGGHGLRATRSLPCPLDDFDRPGIDQRCFDRDANREYFVEPDTFPRVLP